MSAALVLESRDLALDLRALLDDLDPVRWRDELAQSAHERATELQGELDELIERLRTAAADAELPSAEDAISRLREGFDQLPGADEAMASLRESLNEMSETLRSLHWDSDATRAEARAQWMAFRKHMEPAYASLASTLRVEAVHVPALRPTNYARSAMHAGFGVFSVTTLEIVPMHAVQLLVGAFFVFAWVSEIARKRSSRINELLMKVFGVTAHPHEWHRINSATWYATAMLIIALTMPLPVCLVAVVVLGFGDPAAGYVGRRWGRHKLIHGRSLEGSITFAVVGATFTAITLGLLHPAVGGATIAALSVGGAITGAVAELFSKRVDDNLTIPLASAAGALATLSLLGLSL